MIRGKNTGVLFVILFAIGQMMHAQSLPVPEGRRLREIISNKYPDGKLLIGATTGSWGFVEPIGEIMDREFSYVTPENDFKQAVVRADPNKWNWSKADAWLPHIIKNDQLLRIHGPISPQCSKWALDDSRTAKELSLELDTFMTALCMRYNGVEGIKYLDVVNEIALPDGSWHKPKPGTDLWENPWFLIGQDDDPNKTPLYVKQAFAIANKHAPDLKQIINNHCHPGTAGMELVKETVLYLRDRGFRVDGLGWQAHVEVGWATKENLQELRKVIDWCQERDLEFHVTEFDAWIMDPATQTFEGQAYTYKAILDVLLEKPDSLTIGWNTWHITDHDGWKIERIPSFFDDKYYPKPAYYSFQFALEARGDYTTPYEVSINVRHKETGNIIKGCEVTMNDRVLYSDSGGVCNFQSITAGWYDVEASIETMNPFLEKGISIYSDTTITIWLETASNDITYHLVDSWTGTSIAGVEITFDSITRTTGANGMTSFIFPSGTYLANFHLSDYKDFLTEYTIVSDTLISTSLKRSHSDIKFEIKNGDSSVNDVWVVLENDSLKTNLLGICIFESLPVDSSYSFSLSKKNYWPVNGALTLKTDTTIQLQFPKSVANIEFILDTASLDAQNAFVILDSDTNWFDRTGLSKFSNVPIDQKYAYLVKSDNYLENPGNLILNKDTTVIISLISNNIDEVSSPGNVLVFPNPVNKSLKIQSEARFALLEIYNSSGAAVYKYQPEESCFQIDISHLPGGLYWIRLIRYKDDSIIILPIIVQD